MSNSWKGNYTSALGCFPNSCQTLFLPVKVTSPETARLPQDLAKSRIDHGDYEDDSERKTVKIHHQNV